MSLMLAEARESPERVAAFLRDARPEVDALAAAVRAAAPPFALTVARGSSDHAATFAKYLFETRLGLVTASAAPAVVTVYGARPRLRGAFALGVSQSGESPDLLRTMAAAREAGALTAAFVNVPGAPLASLVAHPIGLRAGPETAVAATKTVIASLAALTSLTAALTEDAELHRAFDRLPDMLGLALTADPEPAVALLAQAPRLFVLGRGPGFAVALETALKLKEVCGLHAEAFSAAEFLHGPVAAAGPNVPVVVIATRDAALAGLVDTLSRLRDMGVPRVVLSGDPAALASATAAIALPSPLHPLLDPIAALQAVHPLVVALAVARGRDPDRPQHLSKVTRTV